MNGLPFFKKSKIRKDEPGLTGEPARPSFSVTKLQPKQSHLLGTILSFCLDESSIQMAAVRHLGSSRQVLAIKKEYFPKDLTSQQGRMEMIRREIGEFAAKNASYGSKIALAVSGNETTFRTFLMPDMKRKELDSAIQFEVKKQIPFPADDCIFGYRPIYRVTRDDAAKYKIALLAATKRLIYEQLDPFDKLGLKVSYIYYTQDVIGQFLKHLPDYQEEKNYTLLNIGSKSTEISFYKGSTLEFTHATAISSSMLGVQPAQTKYEFFAELITNEIHTSLDYYAGQYSVSFHDKIYVYGDLAYSSELLALLNDKSGIVLEPLPIQGLQHLVAKEEQADTFPVCLPVLASSTCQSMLANLLPAEQLAARALTKTGIYGRVALAVLMVLLTLSWAMMKGSVSSADDTALELERQVNEFRNSEAFHTYNIIKRDIARNQTYLEQSKQTPSYLSLNLKELSLLTPGEIKLLYFSYDPKQLDKNLYLHGLAIADEVPPEVIVAEYVELLSASAFYEDVKILRHTKKFIENHWQIDFQIQMRGVV